MSERITRCECKSQAGQECERQAGHPGPHSCAAPSYTHSIFWDDMTAPVPPVKQYPKGRKHLRLVKG